MTRPSMPNEYPGETFDALAPDLVSDELLDALAGAGVEVLTDSRTRADHGRDWWPLSIGQVARGEVPHWPGVVVRPRTPADVATVLQLAARHRRSVTAQGGRSGVVGGAVAIDGAIAMDLTALNKIIGIDEVAGTVEVEAGVFGPDLEAVLRPLGWTVGHFPQSFELATVGGWLACRGAGQYSNRYGKIEDIVRGLTVVLASGAVVSLGGRAPRQAVGPDLVQLFVGCEGALSVITSATLCLQRLPAREQRAAYGFSSLSEGLEACRRIMQRGARPAVLRLYDVTESKRIFELETNVLVVLDEGDELLVGPQMEIVLAECAAGTPLDVGCVQTWLDHRNDVGALAPLWEHGVVVDTIEVAGSWSILALMEQRVCAAVRELPETLMVSVHQSHAYLDGACLYFTFAGRPEHDATAYYRQAWDVATRTVLAMGGALSHHHGVGRNRARFVAEALGSAFDVLVTLKVALDPDNLLNPGVLGIGGDPW